MEKIAAIYILGPPILFSFSSLDSDCSSDVEMSTSHSCAFWMEGVLMVGNYVYYGPHVHYGLHVHCGPHGPYSSWWVHTVVMVLIVLMVLMMDPHNSHDESSWFS